MPGTYIEGLRDITRALERAGVEVEDLKEVMGRVAAEATATLQPLIPSRSGRLRSSARGNRAKGKAVVTIGRASAPYAGPINYGWPKRNIKPANFVARADALMESRLTEILAAGWDEIVAKYGLG